MLGQGLKVGGGNNGTAHTPLSPSLHDHSFDAATSGGKIAAAKIWPREPAFLLQLPKDAANVSPLRHRRWDAASVDSRSMPNRYFCRHSRAPALMCSPNSCFVQPAVSTTCKAGISAHHCFRNNTRRPPPEFRQSAKQGCRLLSLNSDACCFRTIPLDVVTHSTTSQPTAERAPAVDATKYISNFCGQKRRQAYAFGSEGGEGSLGGGAEGLVS